jgi:hypothetical protein
VLELIADARAEAILVKVLPDATVWLIGSSPPLKLSFSTITVTTSPIVAVPVRLTVDELLPVVSVAISLGAPTTALENVVA